MKPQQKQKQLFLEKKNIKGIYVTINCPAFWPKTFFTQKTFAQKLFLAFYF